MQQTTFIGLPQNAVTCDVLAHIDQVTAICAENITLGVKQVALWDINDSSLYHFVLYELCIQFAPKRWGNQCTFNEF